MHEESRQNQSVSKWNGCVKSGVKKKWTLMLSAYVAAKLKP